MFGLYYSSWAPDYSIIAIFICGYDIFASLCPRTSFRRVERASSDLRHQEGSRDLCIQSQDSHQSSRLVLEALVSAYSYPVASDDVLNILPNDQASFRWKASQLR